MLTLTGQSVIFFLFMGTRDSINSLKVLLDTGELKRRTAGLYDIRFHTQEVDGPKEVGTPQVSRHNYHAVLTALPFQSLHRTQRE